MMNFRTKVAAVALGVAALVGGTTALADSQLSTSSVSHEALGKLKPKPTYHCHINSALVQAVTGQLYYCHYSSDL